MGEIRTIQKAIVPLVISAVVAILGYFNITEQTTVQEIITLVVTAIAVYFVPNKK